jgi:glycosyltransferase involved in cell wall biosynthesis
LNGVAPLVSVLFLTYKRVHLLKRTLESFTNNTDYPRLELVVADDGSPTAVQQQIRTMPFDKFVLAPKNRGAGSNYNAGQRACSGEYLLFLQDDWECHGPTRYLREAIDAMQANPKIGLVRFYGLDVGINAVRLIDRERDLIEIQKPERVTGANRHIYSDTPHLKSRAFIDAVGEYNEKLPMDQCELEYQDRFLWQDAFYAAFFPRYMNRVFVHIGEAESFRTNSWHARLERKLSASATPLFQRAAPVYKFLRLGYMRIGRPLVRRLAK